MLSIHSRQKVCCLLNLIKGLTLYQTTKLKAFALDKIYVIQTLKFVLERVENIFWFPAFSPFPTMFSKGFCHRVV